MTELSLAELRKGDTVWIKATILHNYPDDITVSFEHNCYTHPAANILKTCVVNHIPAPRPIEIGCKIQLNNHPEETGVVIAIDNDRMWLKWTKGGDAICWLANFTRID